MSAAAGHARFIAAARTALTELGKEYRSAWAASGPSNKAFTRFVEGSLLPAVAGAMGLQYLLTKQDKRGFGQIDGVLWERDASSDSRPSSIHDPRIRGAVEHENAPERADGIRSELHHLLPLPLPLRVLWTYAIPPVDRTNLVQQVQTCASETGADAAWSSPLTIVLGERQWTTGSRELEWCRLVSASLHPDSGVSDWRPLWDDGHERGA